MSDTAGRFVILGYITAVAMPPIGFILGTVLATRSDRAISKHGIWIILLSIVASVIWVVVFTSNVLTSTSTDTSY